MVSLSTFRNLTLTTIIFYFGALGAPAPQKKIDETVKQKILDSYQAEKGTLEALETKKRQTLGVLYEINKEIKKVNKEKARLMEMLLSTESKVNRLNKIIEALQERMAVDRKKLKAQLRTMHQINSQGTLRLIFSNRSSHDLDRDLRFLKILTERDYRSLKEYHKLVAYNNQQKLALKETVDKYESLKGKIKSKEDILLAKQLEKKNLIVKMEGRRREQISSLGTLRSKTKSLLEKSGTEDADLKTLLQTNFFEQKGNLDHPIKGKVVQDFGLMKTEKFNVAISSKGRNYQASFGDQVKSIYSGVVEFVGKLSTFGRTVIIDHGDHYYSVYANVDDVEVSTGERVKPQQTIAYAGKNAFFGGSGIYFEIRHFSEPEDPSHWIKTNRDGELP